VSFDTCEREEAIRALLPLVKTIAKRIKRLVPSFDVDDLVGDGSIGLIRAVDSYDPTHGTPLVHYARRLILGAMLNGIRRMDPVSERARRLVREGESRRYADATALGAMPALSDVERVCPGYIRALTATHRGQPLSLDAPLPDGEIIPSDWSGDPAQILMQRSERAALGSVIDALPERQRTIVVEHYFRGRSLRSIGRRLAISPQRTSQLHLAAIARLKRSSYATQH
jgi:RNA polymerase sigma factor FliA